MIETPELGNKESVERFGHNVHVCSRYFRHAEKASGNVGSGSTFSASNTSERGLEESEILGRQLGVPAKGGIKIYGSAQLRTFETGDATTAGYTKKHSVPHLAPRERKELLYSEPKEYTELYLQKWEAEKKKLMIEKKLLNKNATDDEMHEVYNSLDTTTQANIAEIAEEPVASEWFDESDGDLAKFYPPEHAAAEIAILVRRDLNMPERLPNGREYNMMKFTHKTVTEALLMRILIFENGEKPKKLSDIDGALGLNEGFEFDVQTDENGEKSVIFTMYRVDRSDKNPKYVTQTYDVDLEELERLADLGVKLKKSSVDNKDE